MGAKLLHVRFPRLPKSSVDRLSLGDFMNKSSASGFTLIEILVSLVVLAIGLLGLAGLQATGSKNNLSAYHRSQATQLAYDIADRMRANKSAATNYLTSSMAPSAAQAQTDCETTSTSCSTTDMAQHDLYQWNQALTSSQILPNGQGTITVLGAIYTVSINWDDNRDGNVNGDDPGFQVSFDL